MGEPVDRALLMFKGDTPKAAEDFAKADPYVLNGLIKELGGSAPDDRGG